MIVLLLVLLQYCKFYCVYYPMHPCIITNYVQLRRLHRRLFDPRLDSDESKHFAPISMMGNYHAVCDAVALQLMDVDSVRRAIEMFVY